MEMYHQPQQLFPREITTQIYESMALVGKIVLSCTCKMYYKSLVKEVANIKKSFEIVMNDEEYKVYKKKVQPIFRIQGLINEHRVHNRYHSVTFTPKLTKLTAQECFEVFNVLENRETLLPKSEVIGTTTSYLFWGKK